MTIREAIKEYTEQKSSCIGKDYLDAIFNTGLCLIIPLNNGVRIFIDTHPEMDYLKDKYPLEMPNKNGIFKRISFEIIDNGINPKIPDGLQKYISEVSSNDISYYINTAKEKFINEFINDNGGININEFHDNLKSLWD